MASTEEKESEKRPYSAALAGSRFMENRSLPHKKRRPEEPADLNEQLLQESKARLKSLGITIETPRDYPHPGFAFKTKKKSDEAWMHRLYPFDGPSIEEFTPLFEGVDIDKHVASKLAQMDDPYLTSAIKAYYEKVIQLDHIQYKQAERPPPGTPEDIRPFLLSRHQLKSFNSDYLRSALRKTKVNKSFCILLRSGSRVKGVPQELANLGNDAFARSIRTHQIIAFFMRYYALFMTKYPSKVLDLRDSEHKIVLDCLKDIMRRVTAKKVIQQGVVDVLFAQNSTKAEYGGDHGSPFAAAANDDNENTPIVDIDEKENKSEIQDQSFESISSTTSAAASTSSASPERYAAFTTVLSMLSDEARSVVESMVGSIRRQAQESARRQMCQFSFEEGRKVGIAEGRAIGPEEQEDLNDDDE